MPTSTPIRDTAYAGVGFAVLAVQQANEARAELEKRLTTPNSRLAQRLEAVRESSEAFRQQLEEAFSPYAERVQSQVDNFLAQLPEPAQKAYSDALQLGREFVDGFESFARGVVNESQKEASAIAKTTKTTKTAKTTKTHAA